MVGTFKSELTKLENLLNSLDHSGGAKKKTATKGKKKVSTKGTKKTVGKKVAKKSTKVVKRKAVKGKKKTHRGGKGQEKYRHFKVVTVDGHAEKKHQGRYKVRTHDEAGKELNYSLDQVAKKAFKQWCERHNRKNENCRVKLGLKETTHGSGHKVYNYTVSRKPGSGKVRKAKFPGRGEVTFKTYKVVVKSDGAESNTKGGFTFYSR